MAAQEGQRDSRRVPHAFNSTPSGSRSESYTCRTSPVAWWTCWQTSRGGVEDIRTQPVHLDQHGELIQIEATARGRPVEEGGYLWRGELRLWDNEILMGWYAANDGSVRSKGTMYFVMHPHGISATGRWVGLSYDGNIVTGWSSMARTEADARELVGELKEQNAPSSR